MPKDIKPHGKVPSKAAHASKLYDAKVHDKMVTEIMGAGGFVADFCKAAKICTMTYHNWYLNYATFRDAVDKARVACESHWLNLPREEFRIDIKYWQYIVDKVLGVAAKTVAYTSDMTAEQILNVATQELAAGRMTESAYATWCKGIMLKMQIVHHDIINKQLKELREKAGLPVDASYY